MATPKQPHFVSIDQMSLSRKKNAVFKNSQKELKFCLQTTPSVSPVYICANVEIIQCVSTEKICFSSII